MLWSTMGRVWMAKAHANVRPRSLMRGPKIIKNTFFVFLDVQIHIFTTFFYGRPCEFERSLGGSRALRAVPGRA